MEKPSIALFQYVDEETGEIAYYKRDGVDGELEPVSRPVFHMRLKYCDVTFEDLSQKPDLSVLVD